MRGDPAQGIFETLRLEAGRPLDWEAHVTRLSASAAALYGMSLAPLSPPRTTVSGRLRLLVTPISEVVRVEVVPEPLLVPGGLPPTELAVHVVAGGLGPHKLIDRPCPSSSLVVDEDETALETDVANLFCAFGSRVFTPVADGRLLPGVVRARMLALVGADERHLTLADLASADEVFVTNSIRGVQAVAAVRGVAAWPEPGTFAGRAAHALAGAWQSG